jgi:hypothetical protein
MLVFRDPDMRARIARLRERGVAISALEPGDAVSPGNALLESPDGTALMLLESES